MSAATTEIHTDGMDHAERPWGSWEVLDLGPGYKVKRITVAPDSRLSLQTHAHRAEHWLVVVGVATCTVGTDRTLVGPGRHVFVPRGTVHRIANDGPDELIIVEVQVGAYTGEDDIVRLQDDYGRR
jgi:mannose-6-phosphate isomerase-like protein (cupin superfamily)